MSKKKKTAKPKVEKKPEGPKLEGRKLKMEDLLRFRELKEALADLQANVKANLATVEFLMKTYVKEGETLRQLNTEKGVVVVQLAAKPAVAPTAPEPKKKK